MVEDRPNLAERLSERQRQCLRLLYDRHDAKSIARLLGISTEGVNYHLKEARRALGVDRSLAAARLLHEWEQSADYHLMVVDPMVVEPGPASVTLAPSNEDTANLAVGSTVNEIPVAYVPPSDVPSRRQLPWPVPTAGRPTNDLSPTQNILWIVICAFAIMLLSVGLLASAGAAQQVWRTLLKPYFEP